MERIRGILRNPWTQWALSLAVLVAVLFFMRDHLDFLRTGIEEIRQANPLGVVLSVLAMVLSFYAMAKVMQIMLRAGGVDTTLSSTAALTFASNSWSITLPGGPAFSAILTFKVQRSWGASVVLCSWFFVLSGALSTVWLVALGVSAIFFMGATLNLWSLIASLALMLGLSWLVYWAANNPDRLASWVRTLWPYLNRLRKKPADVGVDKLLGYVDQLRSVTLTGPRFAAAALWSLLNRLLDALALWFCVWAVTGQVPLFESQPDNTTVAGVLLAYVTGKIVGSVQATPGGVGPVEAAFIASLVATGMTAVDATGAVIIYRLCSFILMALIGWAVYFLYFTPKGIRPKVTGGIEPDTMDDDSTAPASPRLPADSTTPERPET